MKQRILLVDDDRDIARAASLRLRAAGYETLVAHDGEAGIASAKQDQPDAILLDVRMPKMNGLEALAQLQQDEQTRHIPIVMLSASLVDQESALDTGARFFLKKPYQGQQLVAAINAALVTQCET